MLKINIGRTFYFAVFEIGILKYFPPKFFNTYDANRLTLLRIVILGFQFHAFISGG